MAAFAKSWRRQLARAAIGEAALDENGFIFWI
jgi:hypothetical protein